MSVTKEAGAGTSGGEIKSYPTPGGQPGASGTTWQDFRVKINIHETGVVPAAPYEDQLGIYMAFIDYHKNVGTLCDPYTGSAECGWKSVTLLEWGVFPKGSTSFDLLAFTDKLELAAEGVGCSKLISFEIFFLPADSGEYDEVFKRAMGRHKEAKSARGRGRTELDVDGETLSLGGAQGAVFDADFDGQGDDTLPGETDLRTLVRDAPDVLRPGKSQNLFLAWDFCSGSTIPGDGPRSIPYAFVD